MNDTRRLRQIRKSLLTWFDASKRDMPWRETDDPYRIWVSEIMLQQTQVKTVIPYFERWVKAFPTIEKLARAKEERVLKLWEGLGYYSRARNRHQAAKTVVKKFDGSVPDSLETLSTLPGIGRYTAGAILSIAFGRRVPVLDGNVKRVVSRLFALKENGVTRQSENRLWDRAEALLPRKRPGDFNQSLMELGATVCLPKKPMCLLCPVQKSCDAFQRGRVEQYPPPKKRTPSKKIEVSAAVILKNGKVFIQKRPLGGLMGGLWEFPGGKLESGEHPEDGLLREIREELAVHITITEKMMTIKHAYTQFRVTLHAYLCRLPKGRIRATQCEQWRWVRREDLKSYTFPAANAKIVRFLTQNGARKS